MRAVHAPFSARAGILRTLAVIAWCWCIAQAITVFVLPALGETICAAGGEAVASPKPRTP